MTDLTLQGYDGERYAVSWPATDPSYIALLCHGYGEHIGRYEYVAQVLGRDGAAVYGIDHVGHGRSAGERVSITDFEKVVDDLHVLDLLARKEHPDLPVVLLGHSMGGLIGMRYGQRYGDTLAGLVLSGPLVGPWEALPQLLAMDEIPDVPIDPAVLSRDPAVGAAYAADPLVWHGAFKRETLLAMQAGIERIGANKLGDIPTLWLHGGDDQLVPIESSRAGFALAHGPNLAAKGYEGARHEIFNETNKDEVLGDVTFFISRCI